MKLTATETALVLRERHRLALDDCAWTNEAVVTAQQLFAMSWWTREQFTEGRWRWDHAAQVMRNTMHPANKLFAQRELLMDAERAVTENPSS